MHVLSFFTILHLSIACDTSEKAPSNSSIDETDSEPSTDETSSDTSTSDTADSEDIIESDTEWGEIHDQPPQTFFASDLSDAVRNGVDGALLKATEEWGNYGPLEYWVLGTDTDAGLELIEQFCDRRDAMGHWDKDSCMEHNTRLDGEHNFMSYLLIGQEVIESGQPMGSMGRNGNRDWGIHLFTSSYPFGFDHIFEYIPPEEEIKTLFHEYFHAVQTAHIQSTNHLEREQLMGPTWFVEGGAEYMANFTTSRLWASGEMTLSENSTLPSFEQRMEWKLIGGLQNMEDNCPGMSIAEISYEDPCSYAAYELGAWGHAYLQSRTSENQLLEVFYPALNDLGWEGSFVHAFSMSSEEFYTEFESFLELPLSEQLAILPAM